MDKIDWCLKQKDGIRLVEPSDNLAKAYLKKAEDSLFSMTLNKIKEWKIATAYYASYFSVYAILQKIGVKCEIHTCTIEFVKSFLTEFLTTGDIDFFESSFIVRRDTQYYVDRQVADEQYEEMIKNTPAFVVKCKNILERIDEKKINEVRTKLVNRKI